MLCLVGGVGLSACGGKEPDPKTVAEDRSESRAERQLAKARESNDEARYRLVIDRFPGTEAAKQAKLELAAIIVGQAEQALASGDWDTAEAKATEAKIDGDLETTEKAVAILNQIDDDRSEKLADEATELVTQGKCASALRTLAEKMGKKPRKRFRDSVQSKTQVPLIECLGKKIDAAIAEGSIEQARMIIETDDATTAFSNEGYQALSLRLQKAVVKKSMTDVDPLLAKKDWTGAIAKLDELVTSGVMNSADRKVAFAVVQDAIHENLKKVMQASMTSKKPSKELAIVERDAEIAKWKELPDDLQEQRRVVEVNVQCEKIECRWQAPRAHWAWGRIKLHPKTAPDGPEQGTIKHAQKVYVVATAKDRALIAKKDTKKAQGAELYGKVEGWISTEHLKKKDTADWLPPQDQMVGVRVWGPLWKGKKDKKDDYVLGVVTKVDGDTLTVKRLADSRTTTVEWKDVFLGNFPAGLKVYAFCIDELHPELAKIEKVVKKGDNPRVKVDCTKGKKTRVEVASALATRRAWLPRRKP